MKVAGLAWLALVVAAAAATPGCGADEPFRPECRIQLPKCESACPSLLMRDIEPTAFDLHDGYVYYQDHARLMRVPASGGVPERIVDERGWGGSALLATDSGAYYIKSDYLFHYPWGGERRALTPVADDLEAPLELAEDGQNVYLLQPQGAVHVVSKQDDTVTSLPVSEPVLAIASGDVELYIALERDLLAFDSQTGTTRVVAPDVRARRIVRADDRLYFGNDSGQIWSVREDGSELRPERVGGGSFLVYGDAILAPCLSRPGLCMDDFLLFHGAFPARAKLDGTRLWWLDGDWFDPERAEPRFCGILQLDLPQAP